MNIKEFKDLEMACKPIIDYLNENYNPYTSVVITSSEIKLVEDLAGIPVVTQTKMDMTNKKGTAQEVPVQEQLSAKEARTLLENQFKKLASREGLSESEFRNMLEIYSILFPDHP